MAVLYDGASDVAVLRQGALLGPIWEHRTVYPPSEITPRSYVGVESIPHALVVVLSPDCDLLQDYDVRFEADPDSDRTELDMDQHPAGVTHTLLCDLFSYDEIRPRFGGMADVWRRVNDNQDERYHHLHASRVGKHGSLFMNDLFLDFKKAFSLPTDQLYEGLLNGSIFRPAILREPNIHDVIHRFSGFLSRVAVDE